MIDEHTAFQNLTDALSRASDAALDVARHRPDQAKQWEKMSEAYKVALEAVWRLAGEGALHSRRKQ